MTVNCAMTEPRTGDGEGNRARAPSLSPAASDYARQGELVKAALRRVLSEVEWPPKAAAEHLRKWTPFHSFIDMKSNIVLFLLLLINYYYLLFMLKIIIKLLIRV